MKIILVMGLPGAGKTTLANEMAPLLNAKRLNADEVRKAANDWDFSEEGRVRQAKRMAEAALKLKADGHYVIADFIAPTPEARSLFPADFRVWVDTIKEGRFEDTNQMFVNPKNFNYDKAPKLEIAIGLESSNPVVLDKSVNKRLRWPHFVKVCKLARDNGAEVKAYILLKPPYLSEKESIDDAVKSAIDAAPHVDKISINPVNVQKNTVVEKLWFRNEWVAPWLWSVVEVLKKCEDLPAVSYTHLTLPTICSV